MPKNFSQKGFTANLLQFMKDLEQNKLCCLDFLTRIFTQDSDTVTFTGTGTKSNPLIATALGGITPTPTNGLSNIGSAIGLGGTLTQDTIINNDNGHTISIEGNNFDTGNAASISLNPSANLQFALSSNDPDSLTGMSISNSANGVGSGAGIEMLNDVGDVGFFYYTSTSNGFINRGLLLGSVNGSGGLVLVANAGPITFNGGFTQPVTTSEYARFTVAGHLGLGIQAPTAILHIKAGTTTAGTAPLKLTSGPVLTIAENGAIEYDGTHFWGTIGTTRIQLDNAPSTGFILNQTTQQAAANFNISGSGTFGNTTTISKNNTGADATSHLVINGTWNTTGSPTLISANITNTASGAAALLMDLRATNTARFRVTATGSLFMAAASTYFQTVPISVAAGGNSGGAGQSTCVGITNSYQQATGVAQQNAIGIQDSIAPTGGSSDSVGLYIASNINQTGTAIGAARGVYYNPSITAILGRNIAWQNTTGDVLIGTTSGNASIGRSFASVPTARLHVGGSAAGAAGTGSIKLDPGTLLATPEDGTLEYDGTHLYFTIGVTRIQIL